MKLPHEFFKQTKNIKIESIQGNEKNTAALGYNPNASTQSFILSFKDGVAYEPEDLWGISHFVEHILFRGTEEIPTLYDISRRVEGIGGRLSAYSTRDMVSFFLKAPPGHEERIFHVFEQLILHPALKPEYIQQEKAIITQERFREVNNPTFLNSLMVENILLSPLPVSRHPVGDDSIIKKIDSEILKKYIGKVYHQNNLHISAAGNLSSDIDKKINSLVSAFPMGEHVQKADFKLKDDCRGANVFHLQSHHKTQAYFSMGWKFPIASKEELFGWKVLGALLGSGYTSILNRVLREKENITYLCTTKFNRYDDTGIFKLNMAMDVKNLSRADECIKKIIDDIRKMKIDVKIFEEAVIKHASAVLFRMEDSLEVAKILTNNLVKENSVFNFEEYFNGLEKVTFESVAELAEKYLVNENRVLFIQTGSPEVENHFRQALKLQKADGGKITTIT